MFGVGEDMRPPTVYRAGELVNWDVSTEHPVLGWIPARPLPFSGYAVLKRLRLAWRVFMGRYDVIDWKDV